MNETALYTFSFILAVFTMIELVKLFSNSTHNSHIAEEATKIRKAKEDHKHLEKRYAELHANYELQNKEVKFRHDKIVHDLNKHIKFMEKILIGQEKLEDYKYYELNDYGHIRFFKED